MRKNQVHNIKSFKETRRELRNNLTPSEATLWKYLKSSGLDGRKFRRQHSIENYIVDFFCPSENLIVEVDGSQHYTPSGLEADKYRDERLSCLGYKVLRFENKLIFNNINGVLQEIKDSFTPPCPS